MPDDLAPAPEDRYAAAIGAGEINLLYQQLPSNLAASAINGLLLAFGLWNVVPQAELASWLVAVLALSAIRVGLLRQYRRSPVQALEYPLWKCRFLVGVGANGVLWGIAGFHFFTPHSELHQILLTFVLAGMSAGAVSTLSPVKGAALLFIGPVLVPYTLKLFLIVDQIHFIMGVMLILFVVMMSMISRRLHAAVANSLRLRFENLDLVADLRHTQDQQELACQALAAEVEQRQCAQQALQESHRELEQRVQQRTRELAQIGDRLVVEKELFRITLASIGDGVITTDRGGRITYLNPSAEHFTGWTSPEVVGKPLESAFRVHRDTALEGTEGAIPDGEPTMAEAQGHLVLTDRRGVDHDVHQSAAPILDRDGAMVGTVLIFRDVSEERRLAQRLSYQATHDALTGLVNRREFERRLDRVLGAIASRAPHTLVYMDLDQFKVVNDTCGHVAGDELLRQISCLMQSAIRSRDTIARLGGDEFGVLLEHCPMAEAVRIAKTVRESVQNFRFGWQDKSFVVGVSLGLVELGPVWENAQSALRAADSACYMAKYRGRNRVYVYRPDDAVVSRRFGEMQWLPRIQQALAEGRFRLYLQPIVPTQRFADEGTLAEVLLRMLDEQGAIVLPGAFLPAAERYGQIVAIDRWVVEQTVAMLRARGNGERKAMLSVNLSGQSFSDQDVLDYIVERIKASRIEPSSLCFEVTETAAISDFTSALPFMTHLRELGCRFALDDFGSGLSSFGYLKSLPVDYLKIDGRFIKDIAQDPIDEAMVEAIHRLGKVMGLKTIAEWVENADTLEKLSAMNVDYAQGFHLAPPRPM